MNTILIKRSFYDNIWSCPLFDIKVVKFGKKYSDKYVAIKIDKIQETQEAILCYVDLINDKDEVIPLFSSRATWIPKSVIKEN